jgi:hypothetical protein
MDRKPAACAACQEGEASEREHVEDPAAPDAVRILGDIADALDDATKAVKEAAAAFRSVDRSG